MKDVASLQNPELGPQADALRGKSKLGANNSGERFEKEADRAADVVTSGRAPLFDFSRIAVRGERPPDASGPEIARESSPVEDEFESALEEPVEDELIDVMRKAASATEIPQSPWMRKLRYVLRVSRLTKSRGARWSRGSVLISGKCAFIRATQRRTAPALSMRMPTLWDHT